MIRKAVGALAGLGLIGGAGSVAYNQHGDATVRITDQGVDQVLIVPEGRHLFPWEYKPDPAPDVWRTVDPAARQVIRLPQGQQPGLNRLPPSSMSIPTPQEPFRNKLAAPLVPHLPGKLPAKEIPLTPPLKGRGLK